MPLTALKPEQRLIDLVGTLDGRWSGYTAMCRCPAHADSRPSLSLRQGDHGILVHCFAGCASEVVLRELGRITPGQHFAPPAAPSPAGHANVDRLWSEASPIPGTPAESYLEHRRIHRHFADLRFHPRCPRGPKPFTKFLPALLVGVRDSKRLRAIQRIFLDSKTDEYTSKIMIGSPGAGSWRGALTTDVLALAEGFETAAAFTQIHDIPCWSPLGARRLDRVEIPRTVTTLILAEDNDGEGRRAARKAWDAYCSGGLTVRRMPPPVRFKDWAEILERR